MLGHVQNRITSEGHVKQTDTDNMISFMNIVKTHSFSAVHVFLYLSLYVFVSVDAYVCCLLYMSAARTQEAALKIMGVSMGVSGGSMWKQRFRVVCGGILHYQEDQERPGKACTPLVARRFYNTKEAKKWVAQDLMNQFLERVRVCLWYFVYVLWFVFFCVGAHAVRASFDRSCLLLGVCAREGAGALDGKHPRHSRAFVRRFKGYLFALFLILSLS
jgi:hypothetical protein